MSVTWSGTATKCSLATRFEWIPEMKEVVRNRDGNEKFADQLLQKYFRPIEGHDWFFNGINKDTIEKVRQGYEERYGKGSLK